MSVKQGIETRKFGLWLTDYFEKKQRYSNYKVFYDHGDSKRHKNVVSTKGFFGDDVSNQNRITHVDVMVTNNKEVELLIEIEERECSPKKFLGDAIAILMCNNFAVKIDKKQESYKPTRKTKVFIVGVLPNNGARIKKVNKVIAPRFIKFSAPKDTVDPKKFTFLFKEDIKFSIEELELRIKELFQ